MRPIPLKDLPLSMRPAKSATRAAGARKANRSGANLESAIYASAGNGPIVLFQLPKCGGRFIAPGKMTHEKIPCDFIGAVRGSGRGVFFDAKCCNEDATGLRLSDPSIVKPHQLDFLRRMSEAGAIAGFLVECQRHKLYLWLSAKNAPAGKLDWESAAWENMGDTQRNVQWNWILTV